MRVGVAGGAGLVLLQRVSPCGTAGIVSRLSIFISGCWLRARLATLADAISFPERVVSFVESRRCGYGTLVVSTFV